MSLEGDLLFPQSDYFSELNHEAVPFDEADFEKDLFGPAASGLSEHSGIQAPHDNYGGFVTDPLNLEEDTFLQSLGGHHEDLEVESKSQASRNKSFQPGLKPEGLHGMYANMPPMMFHYPPASGGFVQQGIGPPGTGEVGEQMDRLALENQHMQQYHRQQELLQAQARQLQAQQAQLQSLQQAQLQQMMFTQGGNLPPQQVVFLGPPRPGAPFFPPPQGLPHTSPLPQVMYAVPHPMQFPQPLSGGMNYHSNVAPIPLDQALSGKYYAGPGATPLQMTSAPLQMNPVSMQMTAPPPISMQMNPPPLRSPLPPLHVSVPVSPRVNAPRSPRPPQQSRVKVEDGVASPTVRQTGRTSSGGEFTTGRTSPPRDKKPPRSPAISDQHLRPPLPASHAMYMPVQYTQGGVNAFPRVASEDLLAQADVNGDVLRPLPPMQQRGGPPGLSALHRSQSSHTLGQMQLGAGPPPEAMGMQGMETTAPYQIPNQGLGTMPARPPSSLGAAGMRRVQSTGDIQSWNQTASGGDPGASVHYDDFKVGRYTLEERKMRIQRYRQKRTERNYNKKIKYVCRKTLADSRPRIRGRFAKNDELPTPSEAKKALEEEEDDSDFDEDMLLEEGNPLLLGGGNFNILDAERLLPSTASAPATLSA